MIMVEHVSLTSAIITTVAFWEPKLTSLSEEIITTKRNNQNRTIKEILGHLIDSTSNNTHRVIHLQYQKSPFEFPNYATFGNNDRWIAIQNYQGEDWTNMIQLWKYSLLHFCHLVNYIDKSSLENEWISGPGSRISLRTMIADFPKHLELHLSEINELIER